MMSSSGSPGGEEHPLPTPATVKELYGNAFRCAEPSCQKPLYRLDNETGDRILNSRISHICARRQGGPRWRVMDSEENRSSANLLLLCIEHSYEIDDPDLVERYSREVLIDWKRGQLAEYDELQRSWRLSDSEASEVVAASFDPGGRLDQSLLEAVRLASRLVSAARRTRNRPRSQMDAWKLTYERARSSSVLWDANGERVYAEPSHAETRGHRDALRDALAAAMRELEPYADALVAELAAVGAGAPQLRSWCDWAGRSASALLQAAGRWPAPPPFADDESMEEAIADLTRSVDALAARWRGDEKAETPPKADSQEIVEEEPESVRLLRDHRALLDEARPFARIDHRPFDRDLEQRLLDATAIAATLPTVPSTFAFDLHATTHLAAAVARNAAEDEFRELLEDARRRRPLATGVLLLREFMLVARKLPRLEVAQEAEARATELLLAETWQGDATWRTNSAYARELLGFEASVTSPTSTAARLSGVLEADPSLLCSVLFGCAEWIERRDSETMTQVLGWGRRYSSLPPWFPSAAVVAAIHDRLPHVTPASEWESERFDEECERLAAQVLQLV